MRRSSVGEHSRSDVLEEAAGIWEFKKNLKVYHFAVSRKLDKVKKSKSQITYENISNFFAFTFSSLFRKSFR